MPRIQSTETRRYQAGGDHYVDMSIQPWDVVDTWPLEQRIGYYRASALKYLMRLGAKDAGEIEARKAAHYCTKLAEVLSGTTSGVNNDEA